MNDEVVHSDDDARSERHPSFNRQRQTVSDDGNGNLMAGSSGIQFAQHGTSSSSGLVGLPPGLPIPQSVTGEAGVVRMTRGSLRRPIDHNNLAASPPLDPGGHRMPSNSDEEEAMLQQAILLSLGQASEISLRGDGKS